MLFRRGIRPSTEFEVSPGVRATKQILRCEVSVRRQEFALWQKAWEASVLALIGEVVDPGRVINGAMLTDKVRR